MILQSRLIIIPISNENKTQTKGMTERHFCPYTVKYVDPNMAVYQIKSQISTKFSMYELD